MTFLLYFGQCPPHPIPCYKATAIVNPKVLCCLEEKLEVFFEVNMDPVIFAESFFIHSVYKSLIQLLLHPRLAKYTIRAYEVLLMLLGIISEAFLL